MEHAKKRRNVLHMFCVALAAGKCGYTIRLKKLFVSVLPKIQDMQGFHGVLGFFWSPFSSSNVALLKTNGHFLKKLPSMGLQWWFVLTLNLPTTQSAPWECLFHNAFPLDLVLHSKAELVLNSPIQYVIKKGNSIFLALWKNKWKIFASKIWMNVSSFA